MDEPVFYPGAGGRVVKILYGRNPVQTHCGTDLFGQYFFVLCGKVKEVDASSLVGGIRYKV